MRLLLAALLAAVAGPVQAANVDLVRPVSLPVAPVAGSSALQLPRLPAALPPGPTPLALLPPGIEAPLPAAAEPSAGPEAAGDTGAVRVRVTVATLPDGAWRGKAGAPRVVPASPATADEQAAAAARRFDGAALFSTTERAPGGRVERTAYRASGGTVWVSRSLAAGRYEAHEHRLERAPRPSDAPRASLTARLEGGVLKVRREGGGETALDAQAEFGRALAAFGPGVRAVEGGWSEGDLAGYNAAVRSGVAPERAALEATTVGRWAAAAGFSRAILPPAARSPMPLFVRPADLLTSRDGALWRRVRVKKAKGLTLERYESGERAVWLETREELGERLVFEFHGERLPPPGTPADAMAIFSRGKDGSVRSFVLADGAVLLDADAERAAFEAAR